MFIQDRIGFKLYDPHQSLGLVEESKVKKIRLFRPGAEEVWIELFGQAKELYPIGEGFFEAIVPEETTFFDYRIYHPSSLLSHDPYCFLPSLSNLDMYLFSEGRHYEAYGVMGGRLITHQEIQGARFTVWAPSARSVAIVGDFNHWDGRLNPMRSLGNCGIWEIFIPGVSAGEKYKFEIIVSSGERLLKSDPYALKAELRPGTASILCEMYKDDWSDDSWMEKRKNSALLPQPINIYEVHLGSWRTSPEGHFLNYREIAKELAAYVKEMEYTHVELMPIAEHPLDESWGYQITGYYAATSRFGDLSDFQFFVNYLHNEGIGVILDWVPGHFPCDSHGLQRFDGTALYEHEDPRQGFHPHWYTHIFNYGRKEVQNFLIANALFWMEVCHIDGLRVDAVASMLYLDYGRSDGEWIPNRYGGKENLEAIDFMKHCNAIVRDKHPGAWMIAEESTSFSGVSHLLDQGGLGFHFKWNMGWMNDTLEYFQKDSLYRNYHHHHLTFGLLYAFSEKFILVFSHDEVVHGKKSLLSKMPGDYWQKFANLRLLISYQMCQPGKKLLFMGGELGCWDEWHCKVGLPWYLLSFPQHDSLQKMVRELNHLYKNSPALWGEDFTTEGFEWIDFADSQNSVVSYLRKYKEKAFLCVHNFTPQYHERYFLKAYGIAKIREVFCSDWDCYGGSGKYAGEEILVFHEGRQVGVEMSLAPLATHILEIEWA